MARIPPLGRFRLPASRHPPPWRSWATRPSSWPCCWRPDTAALGVHSGPSAPWPPSPLIFAGSGLWPARTAAKAGLVPCLAALFVSREIRPHNSWSMPDMGEGAARAEKVQGGREHGEQGEDRQIGLSRLGSDHARSFVRCSSAELGDRTSSPHRPGTHAASASPACWPDTPGRPWLVTGLAVGPAGSSRQNLQEAAALLA